MWDLQKSCAPVDDSSDSGPASLDLVCAHPHDSEMQATRDANCMWMSAHGTSSVNIADPYSTDGWTDSYPYREYWKGKKQPIMRTPNGTWVLQSYVTENVST